MIGILAASLVTFAEILAPGSEYQPPKCSPTVCYLTGPGGWVQEWEAWVDRNAGKTFIVKPPCASACEIAYRRAIRRGFKVIDHRGYRPLKHRRTTIWNFRKN